MACPGGHRFRYINARIPFGFISKSDLYGMSDTETEDIYIDDSDWNDHMASASTTEAFKLAMTIIFDEIKKEPESVSIELEPLERDLGAG
jgi:hypothetical protein